MTDERESELARLRGELAGLESAYGAQCARAERLLLEVRELRNRLERVRCAHQRYQRGDLEREEYEGTIAAVVEEP